MTLLWSILKNFRQNSRTRIIIHLFILVVALSTLRTELFKSMLKNLNGPWRNFWKVQTLFSSTPQQQRKITKASQDIQPIPAVSHMSCMDYHCCISKKYYCVFLVKRFDLAFLDYFDFSIIYTIANYLLLTISYLSIQFSI